MNFMIPFKKLVIGEQEIKAATAVLKSGWLGLGPVTFEFERQLAEYARAKYCIAVNSGTSAIFLSLMAKIHFEELNKSQTVSVPSMLPPEVANAILHAGLRLSWEDNPNWVGSSYRLGTTGVIDSAHEVFNNQYQVLKKSNTDLLCYSFYPTKSIASADGGAILTDNPEYAFWLREARLSGRTVKNTKIKNSWESEVAFAGWKANMTDIQAAIALTQLKKLDQFNKTRAKIRNYYNRALALNNTSLYLYRINVHKRDDFIKYMKKNKIECGIHFKPLHLMETYSNLDPKPLAATEACWSTTVSLPFYPSLTKKQLDLIITLVSKWSQKYVNFLAIAKTERPKGKFQKRIKRLSTINGNSKSLLTIGETG